jgi:hypothetical protein
MPFLRRVGSKVFALGHPRSSPAVDLALRRNLSWTCHLLQRPRDLAASVRPHPKVRTGPWLLPWGFVPLQRLPGSRQRHVGQGYQAQTACAFRFSQPLGAFIRPEPASLVSCWSRSWGSPSRAFLLSRSRSLSPGPLPLLPLEDAHRHSTVVHADRRGYLGTCASSMRDRNRRPTRNPSTSGCCSARESATQASGLSWQERVALLGLSPFQGLPTLRDVRQAGLPSCSWPRREQVPKRPQLQGINLAEPDPPEGRPTLLGFPTS